MIGFPLVIADSEWDMPETKPGPLGWYTSALTTGLWLYEEIMTQTKKKLKNVQNIVISVDGGNPR